MTEPTTTTQPAAAGTILMLTLLIHRDASTKIPAVVPDYEFPVIAAIYGEDHVEEVEQNEVDVDAEINARQAYEALVSKYEKHEGIVRSIYPSVFAFAKHTGTSLGESTPKRAAQSSNRVHPPAAKPTAKTSAKKSAK